MFDQLLQRYAADLDAAMRGAVDRLAAPVADLGVMLRYPFGWVNADGSAHHRPTGKRIRPLLLLLCCEAAGGNWRRALPAAAAVEILHNFSLVHDDIQDASPTRHGRPTVWQVWGQPVAINIGDALLGLANAALYSLAENGASASIVLNAQRHFNDTLLELTRGQHMDMRFEREASVSVPDYLSMVRGKTAALLGACAYLGALVATDDDVLATTYANFGVNLGIAFQMRDDILGIWGDPQVTGKSAATDIQTRKKTLPVLYALERSPALADLYASEPMDTATVAAVVACLEDTGARQHTERVEQEYYTAAMQALDYAAPQPTARAELLALVEALFNRAF